MSASAPKVLLVAADPIPFLSTITGASAGLVAIVGGLLVARFVGLDSEQQGADRVLADARARLETAKKRATDAAGRLLRFEANDFIDDKDVLNAIFAGNTDMAALRAAGPRTTLIDDELRPFISSLADEFSRARTVLSEVIPAYHEVPRADLAQYVEWRKFQRLHHADLPADFTYGVWSRVFYEVSDRRSEEHARWKIDHPDPPKTAIQQMAEGFGQSQQSYMTGIGSISGPDRTDHQAIWARRYDERRSARDRAQQQFEDVEAEVRRLEQDRKRIVKPGAMLWWGIAILVLFGGVGVVAPLWAMSRTPQSLTPHLQDLFWAFVVVFVVLLVYFVVYGWRVSHRRKN